jgi:hypothetical protein
MIRISTLKIERNESESGNLTKAARSTQAIKASRILEIKGGRFSASLKVGTTIVIAVELALFVNVCSFDVDLNLRRFVLYAVHPLGLGQGKNVINKTTMNNRIT